jgi:uncharacterized protein YdhG (YjbR/CyaY superfamily)
LNYLPKFTLKKGLIKMLSDNKIPPKDLWNMIIFRTNNQSYNFWR